MSLRWLRLGLASFAVLTAAFCVNVLLFQPLNGRNSASRNPVPPVAATEMPSAISTGTLVTLNPAARPTAETANRRHGGEDPDVVRAIQRELQARGYETGTADGLPGLVTRAAIMAYESDHGMALTGMPTEPLLQKILFSGTAGDTKPDKPSSAEPGAEAGQVIRTVQQSLTSLGYRPGAVDGRMGDQTVRTIREFEADQGLPVTGRISGQLVARLAHHAGQGKVADRR